MHKVYAYQDIIHHIRPGDIIAFGGQTLFSRWAKFTTRSNVTHVAVVTSSTPCDIDTGKYIHEIFEATVFEKRRGVMHNDLAVRVAKYKGDIWWLPLHSTGREHFSIQNERIAAFMEKEKKKAYDIWQLFGSAVDWFDHHPFWHKLTLNKKDQKSWFCSELVAEVLNISGIAKNINAAETTPIDICSFTIFADEYKQIKGKSSVIETFNSLLPDGWGHPIEKAKELLNEDRTA